MLVYGPGFTPGDLGDAWFNHYLLEHSYRSVTGQLVAGASFWNPPFYFPTPNVHAYSDVLLAAMPFYGVWRVLGVSPGPSYQLWLITVCALNFFVFFKFLSRVFRFEKMPALAGAFLFAFGAPRIAQLGHPQLLAQFYSVAALWYWVEFTRETVSSKKWLYLLGSTLCFAAQFYSGFYLAWFLTIGISFFKLVSIAIAPQREKILKIVKTDLKSILPALALLVALVAPLFYHYRQISIQFGFRSWNETMWMVPPLQAWVYQGPDVWVHFWMKWVKIFQVISHEYEQRLGLGVFTTFFVCMGFYKKRREPLVAALFLSFAIFAGLITKYPPKAFTFWQSLYSLIPGAAAIRVPSRVVTLFLIPAGVALASFFSTQKLKKPAFVFALVVFVLEQGSTMPGYKTVDAASRIDFVVKKYQSLAAERSLSGQGPCKVYFYSPGAWVDRREDGREGHPSHAQLAAMWASFEIGLPTFNGYSGRNPGAEWRDLNDPAVITPSDEKRIKQGLFNWSQARGVDLRDLCWIRG